MPLGKEAAKDETLGLTHFFAEIKTGMSLVEPIDHGEVKFTPELLAALRDALVGLNSTDEKNQFLLGIEKVVVGVVISKLPRNMHLDIAGLVCDLAKQSFLRALLVDLATDDGNARKGVGDLTAKMNSITSSVHLLVAGEAD